MSNSWICSADSEAKRFNLGDAMYIKVKTFSIQKLVLASSNEWCINLYCDTIFWTYLNLTTMGLNNFCWSVFSLFHLHFGIKSFLKLQIYQSDVPVRFAVKRSIFQTFWKPDCCTKSLFFELETSNFGHLLIFKFCWTVQSFSKIGQHWY